MPTYEKLNDYNRKHLSTDRFKIYMKGKNETVEVFAEDTIEITMEREGAPSTLKASFIDDGFAKFANGNAINFMVDGKTFWYGYVFEMSENKSKLIECTCYDQLRYLKNKDTYQYEDISYSDLLKRICTDHGLTMGAIEDTKYKIAGRIEQEKEYWDMLEVANQYTVAYTGELFILHDEAGKICLKNMKSMMVDSMVLDKDIAEDYEYKHSIDENTFNRIKIDMIDEQENYVKTVVAEDRDNIGKWGLLQFYAQTTERDGVEEKAKTLLKSLNRELRSFKAENVFGDVSVRAGSIIPVHIRLRDIAINGNMLVNRVVHKFFGGYHLMDLELYNKDFQFEVDADGYFKKETNKGGVGGAEFGGSGGMVGNTPREKIWSYLLSLGYSKAAIAGIMGNIAQESGFNPNSENSIGAYGLCQWLGSRRKALEAFAKSKGTSPSDIQTQMEFMHKELMAMKGGKDFIKIGDITQAALWFRKRFERPAEWEANDKRRISEAKNAYNDFSNWSIPTSGGSGGTNRFLGYVLKQQGTPYSQAKRMSGAYHDCSSLVLRGMRAAGLDTTGANLTTRTIAGDPRFIQISKNQLRVGDILWKQGHMAIYMGGNKTFEAMNPGTPTGYSSGLNRFTRFYRIKGT